nr:hypothetical protein Q903MT_gene1079 [Picea sitchensis]
MTELCHGGSLSLSMPWKNYYFCRFSVKVKTSYICLRRTFEVAPDYEEPYCLLLGNLMPYSD